MLLTILLSLLCVVLLGITVSAYRWLRRRADDINVYYTAALTAWILADDQSARTAALAATALASGKQRASMIEALNWLGPILLTSGADAGVVAKSFAVLKSEIEKQEIGVPGARSAKFQLATVDLEYAQALDRFDHEVFARRWPDLE